jgi:hypothetical protein
MEFPSTDTNPKPGSRRNFKFHATDSQMHCYCVCESFAIKFRLWRGVAGSTGVLSVRFDTDSTKDDDKWRQQLHARNWLFRALSFALLGKD